MEILRQHDIFNVVHEEIEDECPSSKRRKLGIIKYNPINIDKIIRIDTAYFA